VLFSGTFAKVVREPVAPEAVDRIGYLIGTFIGLAITCVILRWLIGWCCGALRVAFTRNKDDADA
jgi:hypothetical protein